MTHKTAPSKPLSPSLMAGVSRVDEIDKRAQALRDNLKKRKMQSAKMDKENDDTQQD